MPPLAWRRAHGIQRRRWRSREIADHYEMWRGLMTFRQIAEDLGMQPASLLRSLTRSGIKIKENR